MHWNNLHLLLFVLTLAAGFGACTKDERTIEYVNNNKDFVGEWRLLNERPILFGNDTIYQTSEGELVLQEDGTGFIDHPPLYQNEEVLYGIYPERKVAFFTIIDTLYNGEKVFSDESFNIDTNELDYKVLTRELTFVGLDSTISVLEKEWVLERK